MKRLLSACCFFAGVCGLPAGAYAKNCTGLPTQFTGNEFPKGNFVGNFNNNCYLIPFATGNGSGKEQGDLNSMYNKLYFNACPPGAPPNTCINPSLPPYELIILGQFPNSRYFSIGLYDNHSAITQNLTDVNIVPLTSSDINPYQPGVAFVSGQRYGAAIHLGGTPGTLQKGCMMTGYNIEANSMDGTQRHPYMNWNLDPPFFGPNHNLHPLHEVDTPGHSNPNTAGVILIRSYVNLTAATAALQPHIIVRDVVSGCAYPAAYVTGTMNVVSSNATIGNTWQNQIQVQQHDLYATWQSTSCWGNIPSSKIQWLRGAEYVSGANPDAGYLLAYVPAGLTQTLLNAGSVLRFRFRVPTPPLTPCINGCSRSGNEQMRYMSISFQVPGGGTLASLPDSCPLNTVSPCTPLIRDANGYVTLIVSTGTPQPAWVTPANGYTWLDLSQTGNPNYMQLNQIVIRHILPSSWFDCATQYVPFKVDQATTAGAGLMGLYSPSIDYPVATALPTAASPATGPSTCAVYPAGPPEVYSPANPHCGVMQTPPIAITALTTQCANPSCTNLGYSQVAAQPSPPISILGSGFGTFPLGLPYSGNSSFVQISDTTQGWSAGYTGNPCTATIGEWSGSLISLVANVNQNGACPIAAGDQLIVTVWNPQTFSGASFTATAQNVAATKP